MMKLYFIIIGFLCLCVMGIPIVAGYHINTTAEGLLSQEGTYVGAYLGGNQGANNAKSVNFFHKAQPLPYESQILSKPDSYGETKGSGITSIDTGITAFRSSVDAIESGAGAKQVLFSRYYGMTYYPDNDYGKVQFSEGPAPYIWAEKVIKEGGVPVVIFDPYSLTNSQGVLDLNVAVPGAKGNLAGKSGKEIIKDLASNLKVISERNKDASGKPATVLIWFAHEFNTAPSVNPEANDLVDSKNKKAFRSVYRDAYTIFHQYGGDNVQLVWAGNIAQNKKDREHYWPGYGDNMEQLPRDYVDWVGMTWYPWPDGPAKLENLKGFYDFYAKERQHPFIFMETSADGWGNPTTEEQLKEAQVSYLYSRQTLSSYPNIKGIVWFNVAKGEQKNAADFTLVTKNFLLPDGQWQNNGESTAGKVISKSDSTKMMLALYPKAMSDSYFHSAVVSAYVPAPEGAAPVAKFEASPKTGKGPLTVQLTDQSTGGNITRLWDIDNDGDVDYTSANATHTFTEPGTYTVTLTVMDENGASTESFPVVVQSETPVFGEFQSFPMPFVTFGSRDPWANTGIPSIKFFEFNITFKKF